MKYILSLCVFFCIFSTVAISQTLRLDEVMIMREVDRLKKQDELMIRCLHHTQSFEYCFEFYQKQQFRKQERSINSRPCELGFDRQSSLPCERV
jgi:hypothetical protein